MISQVTNYIVNRFQEDKMVNTISLNDKDIADTKKENIYPLVAIVFIEKETTDELHLFTYNIKVLQQRDSNREVKPSKLMEDTNYIDNLNECDDIITNFINYIRRFEISTNLNIETLSTLIPLSGYGGANLDGFEFEITLSLPNTGNCHA